MSRSDSHKKRRRSADGSDNTDGKVSVLETRFAESQTRLNPRRRQLVRAILDSADETCFLSSRELAKRYRVDATTILRATQVLGYQSYSDFSADLRQHFVARITPYTVLRAATQREAKCSRSYRSRVGESARQHQHVEIGSR